MTAHNLEDMLRAARARGEAVLYTPPDGFELIPEPAYPGAPLPAYPLDEHEAAEDP